MKYILAAALTLSPGLSTLATAADPEAPPPGRAVYYLQAGFRTMSRAPLPFQAVRVQFTLRNPGTLTVRGLIPVEDCAELWMQKPTETELTHRKSSYAGIHVGGGLTGGLFTWDPLFELSAGEETYFSFSPDLLHRPVGMSQDDINRSLFDKPGKYVLEFRYPTRNLEGPKFISRRLEIVVREPNGIDREVYEQLTKAPAVAIELLSSDGDPLDKYYEQIKELVDRYPDSSYADYARFALSRRAMLGTGFPMLYQSGEEYTRERLESVYRTIGATFTESSDERLYETLTGSLFPRGLSGEREAVVRRLVGARRRPKEFEPALQEFVEMAYVSFEDCQEAIRQIDAIRDKEGFPYWPMALCVQWLAARRADPPRAYKIEETLNREYFDAVEWIPIQRQELRYPRLWHDFRIRFRAIE